MDETSLPYGMSLRGMSTFVDAFLSSCHTQVAFTMGGNRSACAPKGSRSSLLSLILSSAIATLLTFRSGVFMLGCLFLVFAQLAQIPQAGIAIDRLAEITKPAGLIVVRSKFPETWIWDTTNTEFVTYHILLLLKNALNLMMYG
uniref:MFS transporter n=1 Tax=Angiostrongylus cantonensis TaxID=6313 RepID=A0A0K0DPJ8_ANGCA